MSAETSVDDAGGSTGAGDDPSFDDELPPLHPAHEHRHHEPFESLEELLCLPSPPRGFWRRAGLSPRGERVLDIGFGVLLYAFVVGWVYLLSHAKPGAAADVGARSTMETTVGAVASALSHADAPSTAYLTDALLRATFAPARGISGKLRVVIDTSRNPLRPDSLPAGATVRYDTAGSAPDAGAARVPGAGIWSVAVAIGNAVRPVADLSVISMVPFAAKKNGRVGLYYIGSWPAEKGRKGPPKAPADRYANPSGFIEVTPENENTPVSEHFRLEDFLTHDQPNVWPKYLVLQPRLVDKLELVLADLQQHGVDPRGVHVMSGFRTPQYNAGGGDPTGRASVSRHMYGDASDIFIDDDGDGQMDDLNHDHRVDINDARVILQSVERVEQAHPELVGGAGVYIACCGHGPFIHIDTRGYRARWVGTGGG